MLVLAVGSLFYKCILRLKLRMILIFSRIWNIADSFSDLYYLLFSLFWLLFLTKTLIFR